jgi:glycosyltransferase involved in cell wall biosynthesis
VCDGILDTHACAACTLHGLGLERTPATLLGGLPPKLGAVLGRVGAAGGPWTALRMTDLIQHQHAAFKAFVACADRIIVLCDWAGDLLQRNGVPPAKLTLSRHGLARSDVTPSERRSDASAGAPLRVAYVGRLHATKGVDTLIAALRAQPRLQVTLDVFGVVQDDASSTYERSLRALVEGDPRIQLRTPLRGEKVIDSLATYDVLAVPSRWLETGPLVVLEAFAAGRPVVGSRLGGIAELVRHGVDGLLVEPESIVAWGTALGALATDRQLLSRLTAGVRAPRTIGDVADDMESVYAALVERATAVA